jgi:hypothetical protein
MTWHERGRDGAGLPYYAAEFRGHVRDTRNDGRCAIAYITYETYFRGRWRVHSKRAGKACGKHVSAPATWHNQHAKDARLHVRRVRAKRT